MKHRGGVTADKECKRCKIAGLRFYPIAGRKDGLDKYCVDCRLRFTRASRERSSEVLERYKAKQREWYYDEKVRSILGATV